MNRALSAYSDVYVKTNTNKVEILLELYKGAIRFLEVAEKSMELGEFSKKGEFISKTVKIITELDNALDRKMGGPVVENLAGLYSYMVRCLTKAGIYNNPLLLKEVASLLNGLLSAWEKAAEEIDTNRAPSSNGDTSHNLKETYGGMRVA
ncbi:MAG: flagellar export chaperone FliS [Deltaproteobacteria bacterium]